MIEDDRTLKMRLAILESQVVDLRTRLAEAEESASQLPFSFESIPLDGYRRVMQESLGGEGGGSCLPFDLRISKRMVKVVDDEGATTEVEKTYIDVYTPKASSSVHTGAVASLNTLPFVSDGWHQLLDITESTASSISVYCDVQYILYLQDSLSHENAGRYAIVVSDGTTDSLADGTAAPPAYPDREEAWSLSVGVATKDDEGVWSIAQYNNGAVGVVYAYEGVEKLFIETSSSSSSSGEILEELTADTVLSKDSILYLCKLYGTRITFGDSLELYKESADPVATDIDGNRVFVSKLPVEMHAVDHYDGFIPFP